MDYQFTVLTVSQPITTKASGGEEQAPWSNISGVIGLPGATLSSITISDDDSSFQSGRYNPDPTGQTLTTAVTFGNDAQPTPAGTQISFHLASIIRSTTVNPDGTRDEFRALFPRQVVPGATGPELGGRYSVLLMPVAKPDGSSPTFSLARSYTNKELHPIGRRNDAVA